MTRCSIVTKTGERCKNIGEQMFSDYDTSIHGTRLKLDYWVCMFHINRVKKQG